jgi:hypothetical protein
MYSPSLPAVDVRLIVCSASRLCTNLKQISHDILKVETRELQAIEIIFARLAGVRSISYIFSIFRLFLTIAVKSSLLSEFL